MTLGLTFYKVAASFSISTSSIGDGFVHILDTYHCFFFIRTILVDVKWHLIVDLICVSLMMVNILSPAHWAFVHFLWAMFIQIFCSFLNQVICLFFVVLCMLFWMQIPHQRYCFDFFSHIVWIVFLLYSCSFEAQTFFTLMKCYL